MRSSIKVDGQVAAIGDRRGRVTGRQDADVTTTETDSRRGQTVTTTAVYDKQ